METRKKISLAVLGAMCCLQFSGIVMAAEEEKQAAAEKPTANLSVSALSKYVWRGFELSRDSVVLQPSVTVAYKGFSANVWGNEDTKVYVESAEGANSNNWTETDFTLAYDWTIGPVGLTAGYIYYGLIGPDSQEVFAKAALKTLLTPTLTVYRDYDYFPGWYLTLGVSHTVPITEKIGLSLGAQAGYLDSDAANGFHDGLLTSSIAIPLTESISITPALNYSFPLTSDARDLIKANSQEVLNGGSDGKSDFVYGGITLSMAF